VRPIVIEKLAMAQGLEFLGVFEEDHSGKLFGPCEFDGPQEPADENVDGVSVYRISTTKVLGV